mgnify:CR=1 FL=1
MDFILDKRDATTIKVIDGRKRLVGTIQHAAGRCIVTDCRDVRTGLVLRNEIESQQYFNQFNWSNIMGRTDGDTESRVIITKRQAKRFTGSNDTISKGNREPSLGRWDNVNYAPRFHPKWEDKQSF